jgi:hypothetical protein
MAADKHTRVDEGTRVESQVHAATRVEPRNSTSKTSPSRLPLHRALVELGRRELETLDARRPVLFNCAQLSPQAVQSEH